MSDDPVRVSRVLGRMIESGGWRERLALGRLRSQWGQVVGDQVAAHSAPVKLASGTLTLRAESGAWASELALLAPRLAAASDRWLGGGLVKDVRVYAGR